MGIDAEMLVRVKQREQPTDNDIQRWGWCLVRAVGAAPFFLNDGLPPREYRQAYKEWRDRFDAHPNAKRYDYLSNIPYPRSEEVNDERQALLQSIHNDIGELPEERRRAIDLSEALREAYDDYDEEEEDDEIPKANRIPGKYYTQDGPVMLAGPEEWFLSVSLMTRYYGTGYERGDLLSLCAIAEWCEVNIPNSEIWYGGDSSGVLMIPWPEQERYALRKHLYSHHGRDYYEAFNFGIARGEGKGKGPPPCSLCYPKGKGWFSQYGTGRGGMYAAFNCSGCGKKFVTEDGGKTYRTPKEGQY